MALATLIPIESILSVADAVRNARTVVADYLVDVVDRNQAIAVSVRGVNTLRFVVGLKLRQLNGQEMVQLKRREAVCRAVTCHEDRAVLAAGEILLMIHEVEKQLRRHRQDGSEHESLEMMIRGYHVVLAELAVQAHALSIN